MTVIDLKPNWNVLNFLEKIMYLLSYSFHQYMLLYFSKNRLQNTTYKTTMHKNNLTKQYYNFMDNNFVWTGLIILWRKNI